ncbi:hypothetical protein KP22_12205 [Pectobacterium betavasculorum]|uniref:Uncharacterized protein n=1 Tax=Pectobacterium betavasculorum TaxID=55207 RepID=A0A093RRN3_9GAMM|nr:hypothetical protein KP22_12205 [Pectobacterium betavasculorum]
MTIFLDTDKIGRTFFIALVIAAGKRVICGADGRNVDERVALAGISTTWYKPYLTRQGDASHH